MTSADSPAVARRRVRVALREAREAKGLTQGQVAEEMEWSLSKVMRIESGEVSISINDLRPLLAYLGITERARVDELIQDARVSRIRRAGVPWWDQPGFREHMTPAMRLLVQYESEATVVRQFSTRIVPGSLQTDAYAAAVLNNWAGELSDEDIEVRVETRRRRREQLLARKRPPVYEMLLDEPVLYRRHCADPVAADQFAFLADLVKRGWLRIRLAVYEEAVPLPTIGSYHLFYFGHGGPDDNAVMYRESLLTDEIVEDHHKLDKHRDIFDRLWAAAEDETTSAQRIEERVSLLRKSAS